MKLWIYKLSEFTPWDMREYGERAFRYTMLAEALLSRGHEVLWWTDDFQHFRKERGHRFGRDHFEEVAPGFGIRWVHSPGYRKNVSLRRFRDHWKVAEVMRQDAARWPKPDLILGAMPTDSMADVAVRVGEKFDVPIVLDVRDQWPDVFYDQVPGVARPALWLATLRMRRVVERAFQRASAVTGNTDEFVDWGIKLGNRQRTDLDRAFPIGYRRTGGENYDKIYALEFWRRFGVRKDDGSFKICFLGALSKMYDFEVLIESLKAMADDEIPVKMILCGDGPREEWLKDVAGDCPGLVLPGRIAWNEIRCLLGMCSAGLMPYIDNGNFGDNIANKPAEYLSADLPVISSVKGVLNDLLTEYGCGAHYDGREQLVRYIRLLRDNPDVLADQSAGAGRLFDAKLDSENIYRDFAIYLELISAGGGTEH